MKLYAFRHSNCLGRFISDMPRNVEFGPAYVEFAAPLEWIRVGGEDEPAVLQKLNEQSREEMMRMLPHKVQRKLTQRLSDATMTSRVLRQLAYGNILSDMAGPLAIERERLREERERLKDESEKNESEKREKKEEE